MRVRAIINLFWTDVWDMHSATESHDRVLGWLTDHKIKSKLLSKTITSFIQIQATSSPARACSNGVPCPSVKFVKLKGTGTAVSEYLTGSGAGAAIGTDVASGSAGALLNSDVLGDLERISARGPTGETAFEWARGPTGLALEADPSGTPLTSGGATGGLGGCPAGSGGGPCILILSNWAWSPGGLPWTSHLQLDGAAWQTGELWAAGVVETPELLGDQPERTLKLWKKQLWVKN